MPRPLRAGDVKIAVNRLVDPQRVRMRNRKPKTPTDRPAITGRLGAAIRESHDTPA